MDKYFCSTQKKAALLLPLKDSLFLFRYVVTETRKAERGNLRAPRQNRRSNAPTPSRNRRF